MARLQSDWKVWNFCFWTAWVPKEFFGFLFLWNGASLSKNRRNTSSAKGDMFSLLIDSYWRKNGMFEISLWELLKFRLRHSIEIANLLVVELILRRFRVAECSTSIIPLVRRLPRWRQYAGSRFMEAHCVTDSLFRLIRLAKTSKVRINRHSPFSKKRPSTGSSFPGSVFSQELRVPWTFQLVYGRLTANRHQAVAQRMPLSNYGPIKISPQLEIDLQLFQVLLGNTTEPTSLATPRGCKSYQLSEYCASWSFWAVNWA